MRIIELIEHIKQLLLSHGISFDQIAMSGLEFRDERGSFHALNDDETLQKAVFDKKLTAAVVKGTMDATIAQSPAEMGRTAVEHAWKVLKGEKIQTDVSLGVSLVTKQNALAKQ